MLKEGLGNESLVRITALPPLVQPISKGGAVARGMPEAPVCALRSAIDPKVQDGWALTKNSIPNGLVQDASCTTDCNMSLS
ncbi:MAG: hypothetical protein ACI9X4_001921 [Glaciecola sp.]|jgi:hypothetical protein